MENRTGRKFCAECGAGLARACAACGSLNEARERFCGECGRPLGSQTTAVPSPAPPSPPESPAAERRLVSVLFADLVNFTTLSEQRDTEEVRELLSRYFEQASQLSGRYGGTVEKFIGDAVMAVWGTPTAREDDAERAVRAALELVAGVALLGTTVGAAELRARAGVLTGEAAVTIGAQGQGMVAGDLVNTAARIQAAAEPGSVLVGERTWRATKAAIAYEGAGSHSLKGKTEPVSLWRALRVTARRGGALKAAGLEPPFVGRERELRLVKELFHACAEERKAHLVSVVGIAGIGKSRLSWEFEKYLDGLVRQVWWHRGCPAYGEGVAYWALAEMVRGRARIAEDEAADAARPKLRAALELHVADPEERAWIEPRLAHLIGLEERRAPDREDLFSAWRLLFERLAERQPTVLVFEDLQWADAALLDFIEYLLDWSHAHPLYVLTLARPELAERRPAWGAGKRNFSSLFLEPLSDAAMAELLSGLVPGLPQELAARIRERAEGIPLYAVETVRMLLDRGLLAPEDDRYRLTGPVETLEVPETLYSLIAARLDGVSPAERRLLADASVLGKTFAKSAIAALSGLPAQELELLLGSLVRKEILTQQADPLSPERGQYGFLQTLVQRVAYETLSRKERKVRHLAVAGFYERTWREEDEIAAVLASHYLDAFRAAPEAEDAGAIKARARELHARAARRAASLAANVEAERYFVQAAELAETALARAELLEQAGAEAFAGGRYDAARSHFEQAIALFEGESQGHSAARVSARLGRVVWDQGHIEEALNRLESSFQVLSNQEPDEDLATLAAELARLHHFAGNREPARARIEFALEIAEALRLPELISDALNTKSLLLRASRPEESLALLQHALQVALEHDRAAAALRAYNNLAVFASQRDQHEQALGYARQGLALARKRGDRPSEWRLLSNMTNGLYRAGEWDEALARAAEVPEHARQVGLLVSVPRIDTNRGSVEQTKRLLAWWADMEASADLQERAAYATALAIVLRTEGRYREALSVGERAIDAAAGLGPGNVEAFVEAAEAAFALGELGKVEQLLAGGERLPPVWLTGSRQAHTTRFRARLDAQRGERTAAELGFTQATALFRKLAMPFWLAVALVEQAEWLLKEGRAHEAQPLFLEAKATFERLGARPWRERIARAADKRLEAEALVKPA